MLRDLTNRGLDFTVPRLYVLDGGKALHKAVKQFAGDLAPIQRCQVHKRRNVSAARSLAEGMEETLTVHKLHVPQQLRKILASTNVIESAFSIVETVCRNVKRWHGGDQRERWIGSGLPIAEQQFRRVTGYKQIPGLMRILETFKPSKKPVVTRRKAS